MVAVLHHSVMFSIVTLLAHACQALRRSLIPHACLWLTDVVGVSTQSIFMQTSVLESGIPPEVLAEMIKWRGANTTKRAFVIEDLYSAREYQVRFTR
jgi:hypothetical protein